MIAIKRLIPTLGLLLLTPISAAVAQSCAIHAEGWTLITATAYTVKQTCDMLVFTTPGTTITFPATASIFGVTIFTTSVMNLVPAPGTTLNGGPGFAWDGLLECRSNGTGWYCGSG